MKSPIERSFFDNNVSVKAHKLIKPDLLAAHALTGCDTVASAHGISKMAALKVLRSRKCELNQLGQIHHGQALTVAAEARSVAFVLACYGRGSCRSLTEARQKA